MFKIFSIFILLISTLTISASAASFSDVPEDSTYYEAIEFLKAEEITNGYLDGTFAPNKEITYNDFTMFFIRSFYKEAFGMDIKSAKAEAYTFFADLDCIYEQKAKEQMKEKITWENALQPIMEFSNFNIPPYWTITKEVPNCNSVLDAISFLEYNEIFEKIDKNKTPTRGDIAKLIYFVKKGNPKKSEYKTPIEIKIDAKTNCNKLRSSVLYELTFIPQKYIDIFNQNEWSIYLTNNLKKYCSTQGAKGVTNETEKYIALSTPFYSYDKNILIHEFGHFIDSIDKTNVPSINMYNFEVNKIAELTGEYCKTNRMECFAEAFKYVVFNRNNPEKYKEMKEKIPMSLEYIEKCYLDTNLICDENKAIEITEKYSNIYFK